MPVPLGDALEQLACRLLAEARSQSPQKLLDRPIGDLDDDVGTNLLTWLLDAYDDALAEDSGD
jgi:ABC-type sulfate/molybdate transport systems ATPase subunit